MYNITTLEPRSHWTKINMSAKWQVLSLSLPLCMQTSNVSSGKFSRTEWQLTSDLQGCKTMDACGLQPWWRLWYSYIKVTAAGRGDGKSAVIVLKNCLRKGIRNRILGKVLEEGKVIGSWTASSGRPPPNLWHFHGKFLSLSSVTFSQS